MSNLLRAPGNAALAAVQGIIVGSSCALLLLTDDRLRQIGQAKRILKNVERLKSSKRYHSVAAVERLAAVHDAGPLTDHDATLVDKHLSNRAGVKKQKKHVDSSSDAEGSSRAGLGFQPAGNKERHRMPNLRQDSKRANTSPKINQPEAEKESIYTRLHYIRRYAKVEEIEEEITKLRETLDKLHLQPTEGAETQRIAEELILFCQRCQELGQLISAGRYLAAALQAGHGEIGEADYWKCEPVALVDAILTRAESVIETDPGTASHDIRLATKLLLPKFKAKTEDKARYAAFLNAGERLLQLARTPRQLKQASFVIRRLLARDGNLFELTEKFIIRLCEVSSFRTAFQSFQCRYAHMKPTVRSWNAVGDAMVNNLDTIGHHHAAEILRSLLQCKPAYTQLPAKWSSRLLNAHWKVSRDFAQTKQLFSDLVSATVESKLGYHLAPAYRIMIQTSLEVGDKAAADGYYEQGLARMPAMAQDVKIIGYFALDKAKKGDWDAIWHDFEACPDRAKLSEPFVQILREFMRTHSIGETEAFAERYIDHLGLPVSDHMVQLLANEYGAQRDVDSFIKWLQFCRQRGCQVDAAFSNAIISNFRRRWNFDFRQLRDVFRELRHLSNDYVDDATEANMILAASRHTQNHVNIRQNVKSLHLKSSMTSRRRNAGATRDLYVSMHEAVSLGRYKHALALFSPRRRQEATYDRRCLSLAARAAIEDGGDLDAAISLLAEAQRLGVDCDAAVIPLLRAELAKINLLQSKDEVLPQVRRVIDRFATQNFEIPSSGLNQIASACFKVRAFAAGLRYARAGLDKSGLQHPSSVSSFWLFMYAFCCEADVAGVRWALQGITEYDFGHKTSCLNALVDARRILTKQPQQTLRVQACLQAVDQALQTTRSTRAHLCEDRKVLKQKALEIMADAVAEDKIAVTEPRLQTDGDGISGDKATPLDEPADSQKQDVTLVSEPLPTEDSESPASSVAMSNAGVVIAQHNVLESRNASTDTMLLENKLATQEPVASPSSPLAAGARGHDFTQARFSRADASVAALQKHQSASAKPAKHIARRSTQWVADSSSLSSASEFEQMLQGHRHKDAPVASSKPTRSLAPKTKGQEGGKGWLVDERYRFTSDLGRAYA